MQFMCKNCGAVYPWNTYKFRCDCGGLFVVDQGIYANKAFRVRNNDLSLWRYEDLLPPISAGNRVTLGEGMTPLIKREIFGKEVLLKLEFLFPTGSFKDRGAAVLVSMIKEMGVEEAVLDSSGNAGAAVAGYCAASGIKCNIYLPASTSEGKIKQIRAYGANIVKVPGNRDKTSQAVLEVAGKLYYASHYYNPLFFEGTKTFAFEIWEQLGGNIPGAVIIPVGNGTLLLGAYYGFKLLKEKGIIQNVPRILAVQSQNCCPLYKEYYGEDTSSYIPDPTIAEGIAIGSPVRRKEILEAVRESRGEFITVSDKAVQEAREIMAREGIYIEPTSGTTVAALQKAIELGHLGQDEVAVIPLTGHGLKKGS